MCRITLELCVKCDYSHGFTHDCKNFDSYMGTDPELTKHLNETKETSSNQIMFLLCRTCVHDVEDEKLLTLDSDYSEFIQGLLTSVRKKNNAKIVVMTTKDGGSVHPMM
jgi:hypothetical protein